MKIDPLNPFNKIYESDKNKKEVRKESNEEGKKVSKDSLELSDDAFKLAPVKEKIRQGFYDNPDVLKDISEKLLREIEE